MYVLYSLGLTLLFLALLPYFIYQAVRHGKYAGSFKQRMGWLPVAVRSDGRETIWVHAISVGEFLAARSLIELLKREWPDHRIVVSTTTLTGQELAQSGPHSIDETFYFPFDWNSSVRRVLEWVKPSIVIVLETELWPNFLRECQRRGAVTILANGRISLRSFNRYRWIRSFIKRTLEDFSLIIMQSDADAERSRQLGARSSRVRVCGNLKYDLLGVGDWGLEARLGEESNPQSSTPNLPIDHQFALSSSPHLIVAGSTARGEEEMLLAALGEVRRHVGLDDARLLLAPRHPERFDEVASLIARSGFTFARRSESDDAANKRAAEVVLLDTIGELASAYRFAAVVFVGGSLVPRGGHNIIEPAAFAKPIVVGRHTENFQPIVSDFERADAVVRITGTGEEVITGLTNELVRLLSDREQAQEIGQRAREILLANRGATACTIGAIKKLLEAEGYEPDI